MQTTDAPIPEREAPRQAPPLPLILTLLLSAIVGAWVISWAVMHPNIKATGELRVSGLERPVNIVRDSYGVPHISAATLHDVYFAQGYVTAQDRLFQLDLLRRYISGEIAEIFGSAALPSDLRHRRLRPRALAQRMYAAMSASERLATDAYAAGVNAAMERESLPVEFRFLLYKPKPWKPEDSILTGLATVLDLTTDWDYILMRERFNLALGRKNVDELTPLSDPAYDMPLNGKVSPVSCRPPVHATPPALAAAAMQGIPAFSHAPAEASNAWAIGGKHTSDGNALLANDPHLDHSAPGPWYLIELQAPGLHVTGAALPGTPGVVIGHNNTLAWGVTSALVSTVTVYRDPLSSVRTVERGTINVRFGSPVAFEAQVTPHGFVAAKDGGNAYAAEWTADRDARAPLATFLALDRASSLGDALRVLAAFPGPPLNVVLGERGGRVAYHMAGLIPNDGVWSRYVVDGTHVRDAWRGYVPFQLLPHVNPSRDALVSTANDRLYGAGYPYRLTDHFMPAYRAHRIRELLSRGSSFTIDEQQRFQLDELSLPDREFAQGAAAYLAQIKDPSKEQLAVAWELRSWDGRMSPESREATLAFRLREAALDRYASLVLGTNLGPLWREHEGVTEATASMLCALRSRAVSYEQLLDFRAVKLTQTSWGEEHSVTVHHPLHALGITIFDPAPFRGSGDFASIKVQTSRHSQSFRAVWDVGAWEKGGIVLPLGESGRPGNPHYTDERPVFSEGRLLPLIVKKNDTGTQTLRLAP